MSSTDGMDIGRIISLIMENPKIIEEISALAKKDSDPSAADPPTETAPVSEDAGTARQKPDTPMEKAVAEASATAHSPRAQRTMLLNAFKPYLSKERAKALDSVVSIVDILDMMRAR